MYEDVLVSVITPMYMCEGYVNSFLKSMCSQEHFNIELICVIDGSPDGTLEKVQSFAAKDARIKPISIAHAGAGAARNAGLNVARGEYLMFPDADDLFRRKYISSLLCAVRSNDADIAASLFRIIDTNSKICSVRGYDRFEYADGIAYSSSEIKNPFFPGDVHNKIFKRSFIEKHGLRFMEVMSFNDEFFNMTTVLSASRIVFLNEELYVYRKYVNPHSISLNKKKHLSDSLTVFNAMYEWIVENNLYEKYEAELFGKWRYTLDTYSACGFDEAYCREVAKYLSSTPPWNAMSTKELYNKAGLNCAFFRFQKALLKFALHNNANDLKREMYESVIATKKEIVRLLREDCGIAIESRDRFINALFIEAKAKVIRFFKLKKANKH